MTLKKKFLAAALLVAGAGVELGIYAVAEAAAHPDDVKSAWSALRKAPVPPARAP